MAATPHQVAARRGLTAANVRRRVAKREQQAALAAGYGTNKFGNNQSQVNASPARFFRAEHFVDDFEYIEDPCDAVLLRAAKERLVWASNCYCHHEPAFQDLTIKLIAAATRATSKIDKEAKTITPIWRPKAAVPMKRAVAIARRETPLTVPSTPPPPPVVVKDGYRVGRSLADVVADMFDT